MIMHCPHAVPKCQTCESSAAALELRDLRRVLRAAKNLLEEPASAARLAELRVFAEMANETAFTPPPEGA